MTLFPRYFVFLVTFLTFSLCVIFVASTLKLTGYWVPIRVMELALFGARFSFAAIIVISFFFIITD